VRHGSLLGLSAMLKSWQNSTDTNYSQKNFGRWPQDILTRCLCIIALDRFGDYSGAMIKSSKHDKNELEVLLSKKKQKKKQGINKIDLFVRN